MKTAKKVFWPAKYTTHDFSLLARPVSVFWPCLCWTSSKKCLSSRSTQKYSVSKHFQSPSAMIVRRHSIENDNSVHVRQISLNNQIPWKLNWIETVRLNEMSSYKTYFVRAGPVDWIQRTKVVYMWTMVFWWVEKGAV